MSDVLERLHRKRMTVMNELKKTETNYVDQLHTLIHIFVVPLRDAKDIIPPDKITAIFSNILEILAMNDSFSAELNARLTNAKPSVIISDIFQKIVRVLTMCCVSTYRCLA